MPSHTQAERRKNLNSRGATGGSKGSTGKSTEYTQTARLPGTGTQMPKVVTINDNMRKG